MRRTILHVITGLGRGKAQRALQRLVLADRGSRACVLDLETGRVRDL
jgi:hypothetical protein